MWELVLPLLYLGWALSAGGFLWAFELNRDEGVNLIKAALLSRGYPLYASIWSDQPPLLTHVLGRLIAACGHSVVVPRLVMVLASSAVVWGVGRHLRRRYGLPHALAAQTFILAQPVFYLFSGAIMVGLPAIYLAFAAVFALIHAADTQQSRWLTLSAVLLAISILFKLFTAVVVPVAGLFLATAALAREGDAARARWWVDPLRWTIVLATCLVVLFTLFVGWENGSLLVAGHLQARSNPTVVEWAQRTLWLHLGRVRWLMAAAIVGGAIALFRRDRAMLVFVGWGVLAAVALSVHFPVWMHQQTLVTLPAAVVAGFGAGELLSRSMRLPGGSALQSWLVEPRGIMRGLGPGAMVAGCCLFIAFAQRGMWRTPPNETFRPQSTDPAVVQLLREMELRGREDRLVITDRPMLAYRAGLDVPAWIAALTQKRLTTGQLSEEDLIAEIESYQPAQVVLARLPLPVVRDFLNRTYHLQHSNSLGALYLRTSAAGPRRPPSAAPEWRIALHRPASWYASGEARRLAATVLATQGPNGGWPKGRAARAAGPRRTDEHDETLDNRSTTSQLRFLRLMLAIDDDAAYRAALQRGVDYLLRSQYAAGCWPQVYPHLFSYHAYCTLNDGVTLDAARFLASLQDPASVGLVDGERRARSAQAVTRAVSFLLHAQVRIAGRRTAWCQQYDPLTLEPRPARAFEPVALASRESADVLTFLMQQPDPSEKLKAAVHAGAAWLQGARLSGLRIEERPDARLPNGRDRVAVADPQAPPIWARLYSIDSQRPVFVGRDGAQHAHFNQIEAERRTGYDSLVYDPASVLQDDYPQWCRRHGMVPRRQPPHDRAGG